MRFIVVAIFLLMVACGGQESGDKASVGEPTTPAASQSGSEPAAGAKQAAQEPVAQEPVEKEVPAEVTSCLSLVKQGEYRQAVDVCLAALKVDPGNTDVEAALAKARDEAAKTAAADAASGAASDALGGVPQAPKGLTTP